MERTCFQLAAWACRFPIWMLSSLKLSYDFPHIISVSSLSLSKYWKTWVWISRNGGNCLHVFHLVIHIHQSVHWIGVCDVFSLRQLQHGMFGSYGKNIHDSFQRLAMILGKFLVLDGFWCCGIISLGKVLLYREVYTSCICSLHECGYIWVYDGGPHHDDGREDSLKAGC